MVAWHPSWDRLPYCTAQLVPAVFLACLVEVWPLRRWPMGNTRPGFCRVLQFLCIAQCMVLALYAFEDPIKTQSLALYVVGAVLAVSAVATCVELGFNKAKSAEVGKAEAPTDAKNELAAEHVQYNESWTSAMTVLLFFSAAGAFVELGLGYLEAHFKFLNYGEVAAYYGWNIAALVVLAACAGWLNIRGSVTPAKFVAVLAGFTFAITVILRQVSLGYYSIYSQQGSWLTLIVQVFILELGHLHSQGLIRWTRWDVPASATPPAVSHIHGSAAGAVPGIVSSTLAAAADHKGSMTGMVMQEATKDEILDAFDVFRSSSLDRLWGLHFGTVLPKGQTPVGEQIYRLPFQSGEADRRWDSFVAELASSVTCVANTGLIGKGSTTTIPGSKLLSKFQAADSSQVNNASHFRELGSLLLSQQGSSARFGTCNVMISSQTLRTQTRSLATQEILFKLSHGYNKGLWPVLHKDEPSANLVMPSDAADNASRSQLVASLKDAVSHITSGRAVSMLGGKSNDSPMWQRDGRVVSLLQKLQIMVDNSKLSVVACPQPSLVSEKYMGTRMRMWGALADSKELPVTDLGVNTPRRYAPVDFILFVDEQCQHVAAVLVHAWLNLHQCSAETCLAGELLVEYTPDQQATVSRRVQQEIDETKPVDLLQALGRLAADTAAAGTAFASSRQGSTSPGRQQSSIMSQHEATQGVATISEPARAVSFGRHGVQPQTDSALLQALTGNLAEALQHRCFDYSVDTIWMSSTHDSWRTVLSSAIHKNGLNRRLIAATDVAAKGTMRFGATTEKPDSQVRSVTEVVDFICAWMQQNQCCTAGSLSVLRQVQRCSLELTLHSLLHASVGLSEHGPQEFLSDSNVFVVYLEHMGIGNEVENWYGMSKFRLGRILWNRYQDMRCDGESLVDALPPGKGIYDLEKDDIETQEAPTNTDRHDTVQENTTGFSTAVGNGIFWLIPFIMYFVPLDIVGFSLYDNGRLSEDMRRWLFWAFFCSFLVVGGYFNLLLHFINNHRWRFSGQAQLLAIAQSIPSAFIVFLVSAIPVGAYAFLRSGWQEGAFSAACFVCLSLELTMLMIVGSLTTDGNLWGSRSALTVIAVYCGQLCWNLASRFITKSWDDSIQMAVNVLGLFVFANVAGLMMCIQIRRHAQIWAEALQSSAVTDAKTISRPALQVLLSFHNAMNGTHETPDTVDAAELALIARKAAQTLLTKTKVLRRQRLSIIFDKYCWVVPQGALMHMMITIPYWFGEWGGQGLLKDIYSNVLVMSLAYVITAGAFCEWCWVAKNAAHGMGRAEKHATYMKTLRQLMWWCILIAIICTAFLLLLISTPSWIDPTYTLGKVFGENRTQLYWFYLKLAGYTMMVLKRFDDIMGDTEPSSKTDTLHMFLALCAAVGACVPLARLFSFNAAPPAAVIIAGAVYLGLHLICKWTRQFKTARKEKRGALEVHRLPLSSLIGQPAFSNSTFRQTDLRSALHRLQATKSKLRHKLKPQHKAGQQVVTLLQDWSNAHAASEGTVAPDMKSKEDKRPTVADSTAATAMTVATKTATKSLLDDAYPDMLPIAATALDFWTEGKTEVWVVPFTALNADTGAPQLYSLGVSNSETGILAVHVVASDAELAQVEAGGGEAASRRVAEALLFATSITMLKTTGQVSSMTLSRLDACMWENPESAGSLQQRLIDELTTLPPTVLGNMVDRAPLALMSAIWQQLMGQHSAVGDTTWKDTDLFADMGSTAVADAWQWLPLGARVALVHYLVQLPQLAGELSNSPENRDRLDAALQHLLEVDLLAPAERHALKMATELVVCGEEVHKPGMLADAVANKQNAAATDSPRATGSPTIQAAVRARAHFLPPDALPEGSAEDAAVVATDETPMSPAHQTWAAPRNSNKMSFLGRGQPDSLPRRVLRAYLAVEMLLEVQQAVRQRLQEGPKPVTLPSSPRKSAPKAQKSHLVLEVSPTKAGTESAVAVIQPVSTTETVTLPGADHGLSAQHKTGLVVAESIDAEFLEAQKAAHLTIRSAFSFRMQGSWRLLWLSLMGDASFWQEAMHLLQGLRARHRVLYPFMWPLMVCLQAIANASQVMYIFMCRYAIWDVGGVWSWLVVGQRKTINAVASYDVKGDLLHVFSITRQGLYHSYLSLIASTASQMQSQSPVNSFGEDLATPKSILEMVKAVMGKSFNADDSLYWCQTGKGMCAQTPAPATAISTAFVVRSSRSIKGDDAVKKTWLQRSGIKVVASWLPVWQFHPDDKTSSVWVYASSTAGWPQQKLTWNGTKSLEDGRRALKSQNEPDVITSYGREGRLSAISTRLVTTLENGSAVESKAVVGFHLKPIPHVEESAVDGARCKLETVDNTGVQVALQADLHFSYPVTLVSGKAARVAYTPATPEPENAKALKLPFAAQMHITVPGQEAASQYLLVRTKPPGLNRKVHNLWPSGIQDVDCWFKEGTQTVWQRASLPPWMASAVGCLDVPYAASVWQEAPALPVDLKSSAANNSVQLHTLAHQDIGLSRMLLWWTWKMGMPAVNDVFYPKVTGNEGWAATKSLVQSGVRPVHTANVPPVFDGQSATTMDEALLRDEPMLDQYWNAVGWLSYAKCKLAVSDIKSSLQVAIGSNLLESSDTFSQLAHNHSSLYGYNTVPGNAYTMITPLLAQAGDSSASGDAAEDPDGSLHVVAVDSGTWPTDGGGVATCRELVLDYVQHVRWSVLSEIGNDFKQVQPGYVDHKTLDSVDLLIMWDGQYPSPAQNALAGVPYIDLSWRQYITRASTIKHNFIPVLDVFLMVLLKSSFLSAADVQAYSEAIMQMWRYFQIHDWDRTWASPQVVRTFFATLNAFSHATVGSDATDGDLFGAYDAVQHYMKFICMPKLSTSHLGSVCHASNHGTQAMTGMIFKRLFNQALIVWDHCVYVRERLLWYDTEKAMPFLVRETLARLHRAAADVLYAEADMVTPCCATFNVDWEQWLGHMPETIMPVVNGLDFNTYKSVDRVLAERPTVVMMAHVNPLKDIVTAIRAAKLIVEEYKVTDYQLFVYGNKRQDERYCAKCERLIQQLGMQDHVSLKGLAKPAEILRTGWIYLQSSISEGLPISILEAGMSGLCVVCTDVGGCAETMSDGRRSFGRLTSARNHKMVAYGQMEVMAMLPTLSNPNLSQPPEIDPDMLLARLNDPQVHEKRRLWGVEYKEFIKRKFSLFTHANQQRQAFYLTHYSRQICSGDWDAAQLE